MSSHRSSSPTKIRSVDFIHKEGDIQLHRLPRAGKELARKISNRTAKIGIVGLRYAGLALAVEIAEAGFHVTGVDTDRHRVQSVNAGISYHVEVPNERLFALVSQGKLSATESLGAIESLNVVIVCTQQSSPSAKGKGFADFTATAEMLSNHLRWGQFISLNFPASPGITRKVASEILGRSRLRIGHDVFLIYSCDEDDPAYSYHGHPNAPKVFGGVTPHCTALGKLLFGRGSENTVALSSADCAEMVALFKHSFFSVNSALVMEIALTCRNLGLDIREVIDAAQNKGFGFMAFDPATNAHYYDLLAESTASMVEMERQGVCRQLIDASKHINGLMPAFVLARVADALNELRRSVNGSDILVIGVTRNHNTNGLERSLANEMLDALQSKGATVHYTDPYLPSLSLNGRTLRSQPLSAEILCRMDCTLVLADHSDFDHETLALHCPMILDCCNALKGISTGTIIPL